MSSNLFKNVTGIILVGGKSRRMGQDKAFLKVDGICMLDRILEAFRTCFDRIILVGDREERFSGYDLNVVPDIYPGSALGGIYTGLHAVTTEHSFVSSCDLPYPNVEIIRHLCSLKDDFDAVVPSTLHGFEPLFAVYSKNCLPTIKTFLENGNFCAYAYYPEVKTRAVTDDELSQFNCDGKAFLNINTPEEFEKIGGKL